MCRNIRVLHGFEPPTTPEEIQAASLQFVRKVSGLNAPAHADEAAFAKAIAEVAKSTTKLLEALHPARTPRTREGEREKAKARWKQREARMQQR